MKDEIRQQLCGYLFEIILITVSCSKSRTIVEIEDNIIKIELDLIEIKKNAYRSKKGEKMIPRYLSVSGLKNYLSCPHKYYKAQIERLRPIVSKAYFSFGKAIHKGIEKKIVENLNPVSVFQETWAYEEAVDMQYGSRENHAILKEVGSRMLLAWNGDITTREILEVPARCEVAISAEIGGIPLYGIMDFLSTDAVIDWKTASSDYGEDKALDLQLPFYSLLLELSGHNPERLYGFGVLVKNKTPRVQYMFLPQGDTENLKELIVRAWEGIIAGFFPRIPNSGCSFCDFLPLCLGTEGAEELYASTIETIEEEAAA